MPIIEFSSSQVYMLGPKNWSSWLTTPKGSSSKLLISFLNAHTSDAVKGAFTNPIPPLAPPMGTSLRGIVSQPPALSFHHMYIFHP